MSYQTRADIRRMWRSVYWVGDAATRVNIVFVAGGIGLALTSLWILAAISFAIAFLVLLAALRLFRLAEAHGKVAAAEERHNADWESLRQMGPVKQTATIIFFVLVLLSVAILRYLQWKWELPQ